MVQLKVRMLLCGTGNKRQKSKYMTSLAPGSSDKVLSYNLAQGFYGFASTHWDKKKERKKKWITLKSLQSFGMLKPGDGELKLCLLLL